MWCEIIVYGIETKAGSGEQCYCITICEPNTVCLNIDVTGGSTGAEASGHTSLPFPSSFHFPPFPSYTPPLSLSHPSLLSHPPLFHRPCPPYPIPSPFLPFNTPGLLQQSHVCIADGLMQRLQAVQNAAARLITGARRRDHISPVLRQLHWLPVRQRVQFKLAVLVFKALHGQAPQC